MKKQVELSKRGAAAMAGATRGRSRVFEDRKKYDRRRGKRVED
jgi:hypothetical protein